MEIEKEVEYLTCAQVQAALKVSKNTAYKIIRKVNAKMIEENPDAIIIRGKVSLSYFKEFVKGERR